MSVTDEVMTGGAYRAFARSTLRRAETAICG
jgi:hypothetical protein